MAVETVDWRHRHYPFNAQQSINIVGEIGPLFAMFIANGLYGIAAGTWALIICTVLSLLVSMWILGRPPIMPFIAGAVSLTFGALTLITGDPMWIQIKVTLFNALVALLLWMGLRSGKNFFRFVFRKTFHYTELGWHTLTRNAALFFLATAIANEAVRLGFAHAHIIAFNRVYTGIDVWILFKIFVVMPVTVVFFWWQAQLLQKHRQRDPVRSRNSG